MSTSLLITGRYQPKLQEILSRHGHKLENNPDLIIVEKLEDKTEIIIDQIHELQKKLSLRPFNHETKIAVIYNAQNLNLSSQNALLKTLEEPSENTIIVLCANSDQNLLPTILSRCEIISLTPGIPLLASDLQKTLDLLKEGNFKNREETVQKIDEAIYFSRRNLVKNYSLMKKLLKARKYLLANTNIKLTLENLFL